MRSTETSEHVDVILINSRLVSLYDSRFPPFFALFLSHALKKAGYAVRVLDNHVMSDEAIINVVKTSRPIWVGFFCMTGPIIERNLMFARAIRAIDPKITIVWGGPHPSLLPEETLRHPYVDAVVISEGERTAVELTGALKNNTSLETVRGIGFKRAGIAVVTPPREFIEDWDADVGLDWDAVHMKDHINGVGGYRQIPLITSRGCPYRCAFCWNLKANARKWRAWSADHVISEVRQLMNEGVNYITFEDDHFGVNTKRVETVIGFLKENHIIWSFEGYRVGKHLTDGLMLSFKESGCHHLAFGVECGTQRMLDLIQKDITIEDIMESARLTGKYGIGAKYSWVIGFPGEERSDVFELIDTINRINGINHRAAHFIGIFSPYPGSELYQKSIDAGWQPPQSLEEWGLLREETNLPYQKNMWFLRSVSLACFFAFAIDSPVRTFAKTKWAYKIPVAIFKALSGARWKAKYFSLPFEYKMLFFFKKVISMFSDTKSTGSAQGKVL